MHNKIPAVATVRVNFVVGAFENNRMAYFTRFHAPLLSRCRNSTREHLSDLKVNAAIGRSSQSSPLFRPEDLRGRGNIMSRFGDGSHPTEILPMCAKCRTPMPPTRLAPTWSGHYIGNFECATCGSTVRDRVTLALPEHRAQTPADA
jgi:hypothetical protein